MAIDTARLQLRTFSPEHLLALIEGAEQFEERSGLRAADGLGDFLVSDEVSPAWLAQLRASVAADSVERISVSKRIGPSSPTAPAASR